MHVEIAEHQTDRSSQYNTSKSAAMVNKFQLEVYVCQLEVSELSMFNLPCPARAPAGWIFQSFSTPGHRDTEPTKSTPGHRDTGRQYFKLQLHRDTGTPDLRKVHRHTGRPHTYETRVPVAMSGVPDVRVEVYGRLGGTRPLRRHLP